VPPTFYAGLKAGVVMKYQIKNWSEYQHYKNRNPQWIKLHASLLSSEDWVVLDDASRVLAVACMLIAAKTDNEIDTSEQGGRYMQRVAYLNSEPNFKALISCGFLVPCKQMLADASTLQADARPEESREYVEKEKEYSKPLSSSDEPDRVFAYWQEVMHHPKAKLDRKRRQKIRDRLADGYSTDDLMQAIDGCKRSPHHMGDNDRATVYDDIELICRDAPHVDKFIKLSDQPDMTGMSDAARQTAQAAQRWINEG